MLRHEPQPKNGRALTALLSKAQHCRRVNSSCKHLSSLWVCVCVCVWCGPATGASLRLYLRHDKTTCNIRASGALLQTQPYLTPNIPQGPGRARVAWTRPHTASLYPTQPVNRVPGAHKLGTVHQSTCAYVYRACSVSAASTAENNSVTFQWRKSSAQSFSSALLIGLEVNGTELNINGHDPSSSTDLTITVETSTKHPSLTMLFGGNLFYINLKINSEGHYRSFMRFKVTDCSIHRLLENI